MPSHCNDVVGNIGTKNALMNCNLIFLTNTTETDSLTHADVSAVKRYLIKVWEGARSKTIGDVFDNFRHESIRMARH